MSNSFGASATAEAEGAGADAEGPGSVDVAGEAEAVVGPLAEGLAAPWHAANTTIVLANRPIKRFRI
ncbi:MAG TPA: hypothetical protein VM427_04130 [Patescibacteria group bacterium]|nr:hypothetical protein [Patescibacteria group bacterium]